MPQVRVLRSAAAIERLGQVRNDTVRRALDRGAEVECDRHLLAERRVPVEDHPRPTEQRLVPRVRQVVREKWRHEGEGDHETGMAGADRDGAAPHHALVRPDRGLGQDRDGETEPGAAERERGGDERRARRRKHRQRHESGSQEPGTRPRRETRRQTRGEPARRQRGQRKRRHHQGPFGRSEPPYRDQEQHREEERADERTEHERQGEVRREPAPLVPLGPRMEVRLERGDEREQRDRRLEGEDRPPVGELGQHPPERRADRGPERPRGGPERQPPLGRARQRREECERPGE